jgi:hypothetical protein
MSPLLSCYHGVTGFGQAARPELIAARHPTPEPGVMHLDDCGVVDGREPTHRERSRSPRRVAAIDGHATGGDNGHDGSRSVFVERYVDFAPIGQVLASGDRTDASRGWPVGCLTAQPSFTMRCGRALRW